MPHGTEPDWNQEGCSTIGAGALVLTGVISTSQVRFREAFSSGPIYYSITDGANREAGIGTFNGVDNVVRTEVHSTLLGGVFNNNSPSPLSLTGAAVVSGTFNTHAYDAMNTQIGSNTTRITTNETNIGNNTTQIGINTGNIATNTANITVNADAIALLDTEAGDNTQAIIDLDADVSFRESAVTALENGGLVSQFGNTAVTILAGNGEIIDSYSDPEEQITKDISWPDQNYDLLANGGMPTVTGLGITAIMVDSDGNIQNAPNGISSVQRRKNILLATVEYIDQVITGVRFTPIVSNQIGNILLDLIDYIDGGSKLQGMILRPTGIGDLSLWRDAGQYFTPGVNYSNALDDQNVLQIPAEGDVDVAMLFYPVQFNNGAPILGTELSIVPDDTYELDGAGNLTQLPNNTVTIHYIFESLTGSQFMAYGQRTYPTYAEAVTNLFSDKSEFKFAEEFSKMILLGQIVVGKGASTWDGIAAAVFPTDSATSSGVGSGVNTQAINVSYTDNYGMGKTNVQTGLDEVARLRMTQDQYDAYDARKASAPPPSASNAVALVSDFDTILNQAIGNINNPLLDLPLNNSLAMKQGVGGVTFTRASTATYVDRYGVVQTAGIDEPRFEKEGLLIEEVEVETTRIDWYGNLSEFDSNTIVVDIAKPASIGTPRLLDMAGVFTISVTDTNVSSDFGLSVAGDFTGSFRLTMVFDGVNGFVYKDGVLVGSSTITIVGITFAGDLYLGSDSAGTNSMNAKFKNFRIYDKALSATEVGLL